jgi:hypothetical protein
VEEEFERMAKILTVEDVKQVIAQARGGKSDPLAMFTALFEGLGDNASVSGEVLQKGLKESGIPLPAEAGEILGGIESMEKNGDQVKLTLGAQLQPVVKGTQLRLGPEIAFALQKFPDGMALADITGIQVNKFVWIDIQRLQFHDNAGKRSVRVDTNFGGKEFDLP